MQKELRRRLRDGRNIYRKKMKDQLKQNISVVWKRLKTISGLVRWSYQEWITTCPSGYWTTSLAAHRLVCSMEALQGTVLAPFSLYTADFSLNYPGYKIL